MTSPAGKVRVVVEGDSSKFGAQVQAELGKAMAGVRLNLTPVSNQIRDGISKGVDDGGKALGRLDDDAKAAFSKLGAEANRAFDQLGPDARAAAAQVRSALDTGVQGAGSALSREIQEGLPSAVRAGDLVGAAAAIAMGDAVNLGVTGVGGDAGREIGRDAAAGLVSERPAVAAAGAAVGRAATEGMEAQAPAAARAGAFLATGLKAGLLTATAAVGAGLVALTGFGLKAAGTIEQTKISLESLTGSAAAGQKAFQDLFQFAATTPFELPEVTTVAQQFLAFADSAGLARTQMIPFLTTLGNVASVTGVGASGMQSVALALGQMASAGKVTVGDLRQISTNLPGFSGIAAIAAARGTTTAQAMEDIGKGAISAQDGIAALLKGMQNFPGAASAMEKQSQTLLGVLSTFKDVSRQALSDAFAPVIPQIKASLTGITPIVGQALNQLAPALGGIVATLLPAITGLLQGLVPVLVPILAGVSSGLAALTPAFAPLGAALGTVSTAVGPLLPQIVLLALAFLPLLEAVLKLAPPLLELLVPALTAMTVVLTPVIARIAEFVNWLTGASKPAEVLRFALLGIGAALAIYETVITAVSVATKVWAAAQFLLDVALDANPIGLIILAVAALVGAIVWVALKTTWFQATWEAVWSFLKTVGAWFAGPFAGFFVGAWRSVLEFFAGIGNALSTAWHAVLGFFVGIGHWFAALPGLIGGFLAALPGKLVAALSAAFDAGLHAIGIGIGLVLAAVIILPGKIIAAVEALPGMLANFFSNLWTTLVRDETIGIETVVGFFKALPGRIWDALLTLGPLIGNFFADLWATLVRDETIGIETVIGFFRALPGRIWDALLTLGPIIGNAVVGALDFAKNAAINGFNSIIAFIKSVPGRIADLAGLMASAGLSLIRGLMSGLGQAGSFVGDLASKIVGAIKGFLNQVIGKINSGIAQVDDALPGVTLPRIPSLATGGLTTREGLANLHPRELILPLESARATDLLARALTEAQAGLRATGVLSTGATPQFDVRVYIGGQELTDIVDVQISERNRALAARVQAGAGTR